MLVYGVRASADLPCGVPGVWQWCQNPQYWIKLPSDTSGSGRTVDLKLVVRRTDKAKDTVKSESVSQPTDNHQPLSHCPQSSKHPIPLACLPSVDSVAAARSCGLEQLGTEVSTVAWAYRETLHRWSCRAAADNRKASRDAEKAEVEHLVGMVVCRVPAEEGAAGKKGKKVGQSVGRQAAWPSCLERLALSGS